MTTAQDVSNRWPITFSIMLATMMTSLDVTIANVALPSMQGNLSASTDQIAWVLTSYIVAGAIMTPLSGWLSIRVGRKRVFMASIAGFTVASMLCGVATSLPEIVIFRLVQGACGASLIPLSQAMLLDINPPEEHGRAMAIWAAGVVLGPVMGPVLGGYITEYFSWRWCFYINLPVGLMAALGVWVFLSADTPRLARPFDFMGFGMLVLFVGGLQLILDRGPSLDWFSSTEIWIEAILAAIGLWVFVVHTLTVQHPFFDRALARNTNFVSSTVFSFFFGMVMTSSMALSPAMMQVLLQYPVLTTGILNMPRGIGGFVAMLVVGRMIGRMDVRLILLMGLAIFSFATWQMTRFDLTMDSTPLVISALIQGFGASFIFVPAATVAFATVAPALRSEGSALFTLTRNMGSGVGISVMQALLVSNTQAMHASMAGRIIPSDPMIRATLPTAMDPNTTVGAMLLNSEITRQASMVAYLNDFNLMFILTIASAPLLLLMRGVKRAKGEEPLHVVAE